MIKINKGKEPISLTKYSASIPTKNKENTNIYNDFPENKEDCNLNNRRINLRKALLEDQGYICCYCMQRINCKESKIEHFKPQSKYRHFQIDYKNLFIACKGNEGAIGKKTHCDTKKGNNLLSAINLLEPIEDQIKYKKDGTIYSNNEAIQKEINQVLNLNLAILKRNRSQVYSDMIMNLNNKKWTKSSINHCIIGYESKDINGKYAPYFAVILFFLNKKRHQLSQRASND